VPGSKRALARTDAFGSPHGRERKLDDNALADVPVAGRMPGGAHVLAAQTLEREDPRCAGASDRGHQVPWRDEQAHLAVDLPKLTPQDVKKPEIAGS
jgi:hypothetical protein